MTAATEPLVSVIMVITPNRGYDSVFETLASFRADASIPHEVLCADRDGSPNTERLHREFPYVRIVWCEPGEPIPAARNRAIAAAHGSLLAFVDDHIRFPENYLMVLKKSFAMGDDIIGGSVANANPETYDSWTHYFVEYSKWLDGIPTPDSSDLPGSNWAIRREFFDRLGGFNRAGFGLETHLLAEWRKKQARIRHEPELVIGHIHVTKISVFWPISFQYGRWYAAKLSVSPLQRPLRAAAFPAVTAVLFWRSFTQARQHPVYLHRFLATSPMVLLTFLIRALGESCGHLLGAPAEEPHR
jgi:glycosyltransferase involved in cell wall biosynthesis